MEVDATAVAAGAGFTELNALLGQHHAVLQAPSPVIRVALSLSTNNGDCGFSQQGSGIFERPSTQGNMVRGNGADTGGACGTVTIFPAI